MNLLKRRAVVAYETLRRWNREGLVAPVAIQGTRFAIFIKERKIHLVDCQRLNPLFAAKSAGCPCGCTSPQKVRRFKATWEGFATMFEEVERRSLPKPAASHKAIAAGGRRQTQSRARLAVLYSERIA